VGLLVQAPVIEAAPAHSAGASLFVCSQLAVNTGVDMPRVLNKYVSGFPAGSVNIMRPGKWGNPFAMHNGMSRDQVIAKFRDMVERNPELIAAIKRELHGKDLVCCCAPQRCHGDVLLEIANG
jgi:hypothetical protein